MFGFCALSSLSCILTSAFLDVLEQKRDDGWRYLVADSVPVDGAARGSNASLRLEDLLPPASAGSSA